MKQIKSASLALYLSIWLGLIIVGIFIGGTTYMKHLEAVHGIISNPLEGVLTMLKEAFTSSTFWIFTAVTTIVGGGLIVATTGNGFAVLYIFPFVMIFSLLNLFILPQSLIMGEQSQYANLTLEQGTPESSPTITAIQYVFVAFFGILTILTVYTFITGRN